MLHWIVLARLSKALPLLHKTNKTFVRIQSGQRKRNVSKTFLTFETIHNGPLPYVL